MWEKQLCLHNTFLQIFVLLSHLKLLMRAFSSRWIQNVNILISWEFFSKGEGKLIRANKQRCRWIQVKENFTSGRPLHQIASFLEPIRYVEKFITWQNQSIHTPPGCMPNQTTLFNYRWIIIPLNFLQMTSACLRPVAEGRYWVKA